MQLRSASLASLMLAASVRSRPPRTSLPEPHPLCQPAGGAAMERVHSPPEHGFAVSFPGTPKVTTAPVEGQNPLLQHDFQVSLGEDTVYSVVVFEYPQGKAPKPPTPTITSSSSTPTPKAARRGSGARGPATVDGRAGFEGIADDGKNKLELIS